VGATELQQAAVPCLLCGTVDSDLGGSDPCSGCHSVDKGCLDPSNIVVKVVEGGVERDNRSDPLGVGADKALGAPALQQGGAPSHRACVGGAGDGRGCCGRSTVLILRTCHAGALASGALVVAKATVDRGGCGDRIAHGPHRAGSAA